MRPSSRQEKLDEDLVRFFVWAVWNFFQKNSRNELKVDPPYLADGFEHDEVTGIIGVSGCQKGAVYFTMGTPLLDKVIRENFGDEVRTDVGPEELQDLYADYAGEMANTVSGNVRNYLGENFLISVPVVVRSPKKPFVLPEETTGIVFPIEWGGHRCHLVVGFEAGAIEYGGDEKVKPPTFGK